MFSKRIDRIQPSATLEMTAKAAELRSKGVEVLTTSNSYSIKYDGPKKSTIERIKEFVK